MALRGRILLEDISVLDRGPVRFYVCWRVYTGCPILEILPFRGKRSYQSTMLHPAQWLEKGAVLLGFDNFESNQNGKMVPLKKWVGTTSKWQPMVEWTNAIT